MAKYQGDVVQNQQGRWRFRETGSTNLQRLSKAPIQEPTSVRIEKEITLDQYADTSITVDGDWEHEWILDATVETQVGNTVPNEQEYFKILNRIQGAMIYSCQELAQLADSVDDPTSARLRKLARVLERICNETSNPAPIDLPTEDTPLGTA